MAEITSHKSFYWVSELKPSLHLQIRRDQTEVQADWVPCDCIVVFTKLHFPYRL